MKAVTDWCRTHGYLTNEERLKIAGGIKSDFVAVLPRAVAP